MKICKSKFFAFLVFLVVFSATIPVYAAQPNGITIKLHPKQEDNMTITITDSKLISTENETPQEQGKTQAKRPPEIIVIDSKLTGEELASLSPREMDALIAKNILVIDHAYTQTAKNKIQIHLPSHRGEAWLLLYECAACGESVQFFVF